MGDASQMYFKFDTLDLRYEPFPIGIARPAFADDDYRKLLDTYPPLELFQYIPKVGNKYCLSEKFHGDKYHDWVANHANWKDFHAWMKSEDFVFTVLDALKERHVDLGFVRRAASKKLRKQLANILKGKWWKQEERLSARFEFSALPADG